MKYCETVAKCIPGRNDVNPIGYFPISSCSAGDGRWVEVYSQEAGHSFNRLHECSLESCNLKDDEHNFINFDTVKHLSQYRMKLQWNGALTLEWTQNANPLNVYDTNLNVDCTNNCFASPGVGYASFEGLSKSSSGCV